MGMVYWLICGRFFSCFYDCTINQTRNGRL